MFSYFQKLVTRPLLTDEGQTQIARLLFVILWTLIVSSTALALLGLLVSPENTLRVVLFIGGLDTINLILLSLTQRGQTRPASVLLGVELWALVTGYAWISGGIYSPALAAYLVVVFIAGLLLGGRAGVFTAAVCGLTGLGMALAISSGGSSSDFNPFSLWLLSVVWLMLMAGLHSLAINMASGALRHSERRFRMVLDNLGEGVAVQDSDWRYTYANPAAHAIVDWPPGQLVGVTETAILSSGGQALSQQHNLRRIKGEISSYEVEVVRPTGEVRTIIATGVPRLNEQNQLVETFVTFTDITERKQAEATLRHYTERLETLHEIDRSLLSARSLYDTAKAALIRIRRLVPCRRASATLFDFEKNEASFLAADFDGLQTIPDTPIPIAEYGWGVVDRLQKNQPWFTADMLNDPDLTMLNQRLVNEDGLHTWLALPLLYQGHLIGAINLGRGAGQAFTTDEALIVRDVADQIAIAIQQHRLFEATQRQVRELTVLHAVAVAGVSATTEEALLEQVIEIIGASLYPDMFSILLMDEAAQSLRVGARRGVPEEARRAVIPLQLGIVGAVAQSGQARRVPDVRQEPAYYELIPGLQSELCVPIKSGERVLGVIDVESKRRDAFSEADERLLTTVAGQLSNALERQRVTAALRQSEERYRLISSLSTDYVFSSTVYADGQLSYDWQAGAFESISGYTPDEYRQRGWRAIVHPEDLAIDDALLEKLHSNQKASGEMRLITKSGETRWITNYAHPVWDERANRLSGIYGAVRDITKRKQAEDEIRQLNAELEQRVRERTAQLHDANQNLHQEKTRLERYNRQRELMAALTDLLQASLTTAEASAVVSTHLQLLFPQRAGALYLLNTPGTFEPIALWGEQKSLDTIFAMNECWALRRGKPYRFGRGLPNPPCAHVGSTLPHQALCLPLSAQGESLGNLHISIPTDQRADSLDDEEQRFIETLADSIALALANVRLREQLGIQSIRDGLTGLFNRRYLDETLPREIHRAERSQRPLSVVMFDIDRFKRINDTYGHDAGDVVLKRVAELVLANIRSSDMACRYGGEEFTIVLPDTSLEVAYTRAEALREAASRMTLQHNGQDLGQVTISVGVAAYPQHGRTRDPLLKSADEASYRAKHKPGGRNSVELALSE